ncbi:MAG: 4Fe-4S binding protein [Lachnospirales bacterium]
MNKKVSDWYRHKYQIIWALITNSYILGFTNRTIYQGRLKSVCVPGMNCYSCPGALGACPIGSFQAVIGSAQYKFSIYITGFFLLYGGIFGRFICGWLCPFGLFQDLIHKIPFPKKIQTFKGDMLLRKAKYFFLIVFVILMPLFLVNIIGIGSPYFCKLICPVGTLEAGIPLVLLKPNLRGSLGFLYLWKNFLLMITVLSAIIIYRPFCKYVCPLGAVYSIFNSVSIYKLSVANHKCINCGKCARVCKMGVNPVKNPSSPECIRCTLCKKECPKSAISTGFKN